MRIDQETKILGLVGFPLGHSLSPAMHNRALAAIGINAVYLPFPVEPERVPLVVAGAKTFGLRGFNVTIPFKESIMPFLDQVDPRARACGAVNTVVIEDGRAVGYNTDGPGFLDSLEQEGLGIPGLAVILGAGGAARAIGYHLGAGGALTVFVNRSGERARSLADDISRATGEESIGMAWDDRRCRDYLARAGLVVNTTPLGMHPHIEARPPLDLKGLNPEAAVADIVYNPLTTRLLQEAGGRGFKTVNGLGMLLNQGARSFQLFTGCPAPRHLMEEQLKSCLEKA